MEYRIIYSKRKTLSLEINHDCEVLVRAPLGTPRRAIDSFVKGHEEWLNRALEKQKKRAESLRGIPRLTGQEIDYLADRACIRFAERVKYFAPIVGVTYGRITIRNQSTRWGSCSAKGNLNFNCLLMLAPDEVLDYVVVHELCHRLQMNHSAKFWAEVERVCPDYRTHRKWLKTEGLRIMEMQRP